MRYFSLSFYLKSTFGEKLLKLPINAGFSCPNRVNGKGGCRFCSESGANDFTFLDESITNQLIKQKSFLKNKFSENSYIAYFQNYTNTFKDVKYLRSIYEEAINFDGVKVLSIATRSDCLNEEVLNLLYDLNKKIEVWVELGLQSSNEKTRREMNIGFSLKTFENSVFELKKRNIKTIFHVIFGLPRETKEDFLNTINYVNKFSPFGLKIHSLYIQKDSPLYHDYLKENFKLLTFNEYVDSVVCAIENLNPKIVLHRLTGDANKELLFLPEWSKDKIKVIGEIGKILKQRNSYQGIFYRE